MHTELLRAHPQRSRVGRLRGLLTLCVLLLAVSCSDAKEANPYAALLKNPDLRAAARERFLMSKRTTVEVQRPTAGITIGGVSIDSVGPASDGASARLVSAFVASGPSKPMRLRVMDMRRERRVLAEADLRLAGLSQPQLMVVVVDPELELPQLHVVPGKAGESAVVRLPGRGLRPDAGDADAFDMLKPESLGFRIDTGELTMIGLWSWNGADTALIAASKTMEYGGHLTGSVPEELGPNWECFEAWPAPLLGLSVEVLAD